MKTLAALVSLMAALLVVGAAAAETATFTPEEIRFVPSHQRGDRDFKGHGPTIDVSTSVHMVLDREIHVLVRMRAKETGGDHTTAEGSETYVLYTAPLGKRIVRIVEPVENLLQSHGFTDAGPSSTIYVPDTEGPVKRYRIVGDLDGDESGSRTRVEVSFNPITVELADRTTEPGEEYVLSAPKDVVVPVQVTAGDGDFGNNDTFLSMKAEVFVHEGSLRCKLSFKAREKKSDWTTVEGSKIVTLYTAPEGKKVLGIKGTYISGFETLVVGGGVSLAPNLKENFEQFFPSGPACAMQVSFYIKGGDRAAVTKAIARLRALEILIADVPSLKGDHGNPKQGGMVSVPTH